MARNVSRLLKARAAARWVALSVALLAGLTFSATGGALDVMITPSLGSVETLHEGKRVVVQRNQDRRNTVRPFFTYTSRRCPPFCLQPIVAAPGVETYGELEVLKVLERLGQGDDSVLLVDARTAQWPKRGMIPGAVNIPWSEFDVDSEGELFDRVFQPYFGVKMIDGVLDFSDAKTVVLYCNGIWCSQSTNAIDALLDVGYPPEKLKWYRGGMQDWESAGLTTVVSGQ
jgi:rhodanese-related sulfurtransferase